MKPGSIASVPPIPVGSFGTSPVMPNVMQQALIFWATHSGSGSPQSMHMRTGIG
jgi:hypothetical protein